MKRTHIRRVFNLVEDFGRHQQGITLLLPRSSRLNFLHPPPPVGGGGDGVVSASVQHWFQSKYLSLRDEIWHAYQYVIGIIKALPLRCSTFAGGLVNTGARFAVSRAGVWRLSPSRRCRSWSRGRRS